MKTKHLIITFLVVALFVTGASFLSLKPDYSSLAIDNIEALSDPEQPNVADCVEKKDVTCVALHPTDSTLDVKRENAEWK